MANARNARHRYVALLRAVNVGGFSVIKMADLRRLLESCGFTDVVTHIQSGNAVFTSTSADAHAVEQKIEDVLAKSFGRATTVFVLSPAELKRAAARNPFSPHGPGPTDRSHLMFLSSTPTADRRRALLALAGKDYRFHVEGRVLYYSYPREYEGKRRTINFERVLGVSGTARNSNVVDKLIALSSAVPTADESPIAE